MHFAPCGLVDDIVTIHKQQKPHIAWHDAAGRIPDAAMVGQAFISYCCKFHEEASLLTAPRKALILEYSV